MHQFKVMFAEPADLVVARKRSAMATMSCACAMSALRSWNAVSSALRRAQSNHKTGCRAGCSTRLQLEAVVLSFGISGL